MPILSTHQLTKKYGSLTAVNQLNLTIEKGQVVGLLGPNGSGKTTTLGMLLGVIHPTSGSYTWFDGQYGNKERMHIGTLLETPNFYPYMSARKNMEIVSQIKKSNPKEIDQLLDSVNLLGWANNKFRSFSLGMKQRLAIAAAMVGDPKVLILDEPTNGLDPEGIAEVRGIVQNIAQSGKTIIMASHILDEIEKTCSHVAIIKQGNLLVHGTVGAILTSDKLIEVAARDMDVLQNFLGRFSEIKKIQTEKEHFIITLPEEAFGADVLNKAAFEQGITLTRLLERKQSLEAEFLKITQK